jgi:hypothetical protein
MLSLNHALYGRVFGSGYGDMASLFSPSHVGDNARNFSRALFATQHVVPVLGLLAPFVLVAGRRTAAMVLLAAAALTTGIYLLYRPYPEWWYLRFLMPALVIMLILASAVAVEVASRGRMRGVIPILAVLLAILGAREAGARDVFALQGLEGRYRDTAAVVSERLPANAVLITVWQSGSVRFHAAREVVMWDSLDPDWLDRAVAWLAQRGLKPYLLVERREEAEFRERFRGHAEIGALDAAVRRQPPGSNLRPVRSRPLPRRRILRHREHLASAALKIQPQIAQIARIRRCASFVPAGQGRGRPTPHLRHLRHLWPDCHNAAEILASVAPTLSARGPWSPWHSYPRKK